MQYIISQEEMDRIKHLIKEAVESNDPELKHKNLIIISNHLRMDLDD